MHLFKVSVKLKYHQKLCFKVQKADGKLDMIAWQIDAFEKEFQDPETEVFNESSH